MKRNCCSFVQSLTCQEWCMGMPKYPVWEQFTVQANTTINTSQPCTVFNWIHITLYLCVLCVKLNDLYRIWVRPSVLGFILVLHIWILVKLHYSFSRFMNVQLPNTEYSVRNIWTRPSLLKLTDMRSVVTTVWSGKVQLPDPGYSVRNVWPRPSLLKLTDMGSVVTIVRLVKSC